MSNLQHRLIKIRNSKINSEENLQLLMNALSQMEKGVDVVITMQVEESKIKKLRALYFTLVTELGKHAGYMSRNEREEFKEQIKSELKVESISSINDCDEMLIIIESLHQLASTHYNYIFKPNDPGIFNFDFKSS